MDAGNWMLDIGYWMLDTGLEFNDVKSELRRNSRGFIAPSYVDKLSLQHYRGFGIATLGAVHKVNMVFIQATNIA